MLGGRQQNKFQRSETAEQVPKVKDSRTAEQVPSIVPTRSHYQQQHQAKERRRYPEPLITSSGKPGCDEGIAF
jgi:hypothetical protein